MKKLFEEFKTFISKGNVLGLAIGDRKSVV